jgi:hypothetical protein
LDTGSDRKLGHERSDGLFEAVRRTTATSDVEVNHLLTLRSPNANDWGELGHHVGPCDATEVDAFLADLPLRSFARLAVRVTAVLRGAVKCSEGTT